MRSHVVGALLLVACTEKDGPGDGVEPTTDGTLTTGTDAFAAVATVSTEVPTVAFVTWTSAAAGTSLVRFGLTGEPLDRVTPVGPAGTAHQRTLLGLKAGRTYDWQAVTTLPDGSEQASAVGTVTLPPVPQGMPGVEVVTSDPARSALAHGYVLTSVMTTEGSWIVILDGEGDYVWYRPAAPDTLVTTSRPGLDGVSVLWGSYDNQQQDDIGIVERWRLDGTSHTTTRTLMAHHDFYEHVDGTLAWTSYVFQQQGPVLIASDAIREAPEGTADPIDQQVFSWFDDYGHDPFIPSPTAEGSTIPYEGQLAQEWTHSNSLMYDPDAGAYFLMSKFMDALVKIDRATGAVLWQINGLYGSFTDPSGAAPWRAYDDTDLWSHAHMSHLWDGGAMIFDNGYHYTPEHSGAIEIAFDEATGTVETVWRYDEPDGNFTPLMGDVRWITETDTVLIGWSDIAVISEVTHDDRQEEVWRLEPTSIGHIYGRMHYLADLYDLPDP